MTEGEVVVCTENLCLRIQVYFYICSYEGPPIYYVIRDRGGVFKVYYNIADLVEVWKGLDHFQYYIQVGFLNWASPENVCPPVWEAQLKKNTLYLCFFMLFTGEG